MVFPLSIFIILVTLWQGAIELHESWRNLLPPPSDVARALFELMKDGQLWEHAGASLSRVFLGFSVAALLGIPLGMLLGWKKYLWDAFNPLIQMLKTISPIAWIPLAILWFGIGDKPAVFIIFMTSFFPILITTAHANRQIDPYIIKTAINFGANGNFLFFKVILPASLPYIMVGLRIALGIAWVVIVAAEMVGMRSGLGFLILDARNALRTDMIIAGMFSIGIIGMTLDYVISSFEKYLEKHKIRSELGWT